MARVFVRVYIERRAMRMPPRARALFLLFSQLFEFKMRPLVIIISLLNVLSSTNCTNDRCSIDDRISCDDDRRTGDNLEEIDKKYNDIYERIKEAEARYLPCDSRQCGCFSGVLNRDLRSFANGIDAKTIEASKLRGTLYQVIGGGLYREKECAFPSRCDGVEHFLLKVAKNMTRDTEFVVNTRDYPQSSVHFGDPLPIFSFSKTADYYDVTYPAWSFWDGGPAISLYPKGLGRWDEHRISIDRSRRDNPWEKREKKAFFRGSRTSAERDNLILLSRDKPEIVDAAYTKNQAWKSKADTLDAEPAREASLESHCRYKYLFNYRGVAASFRHKHLFLCASLVFHVGDEWTEFYYEAMKPWIHYVPVDKDAGRDELENLIEFAKENDRLAKTIAERGRDFVWDHLRMKDVTCYWRKLLEKYSELLSYEPRLRPDFLRVG